MKVSLLVYHFPQGSPSGLFCFGTFPINEKIHKIQTLYIKVIMFIVNILKILVPTCYSPKAFLSNRDAGLLSLC